MHSRRSVLRTFSVATAAVAAPRVHASQASKHAHAPPWWLLHPLSEGDELDCGWTLDQLGPIVDGSSVVELTHPRQDPLRIHLCLHEGSPKGFAHTELFDLIVIDHGRGIRPVPEDLVPVLQKLEKAIQDNELASHSSFDHIADMMTHKERVAAFGAGQIQ